MSGFRKAKAEQAAIKMGLYGPPGSGKTFTALLIAEGLAKLDGKRIAYVDTERGTDFYCKAAPRSVHPEAFDFDALYTRSITEVSNNIKALDPSAYSCVVIDSITHIWEAAKEAYTGKLTKVGTMPFHAWGKIKKPYKDLMGYLLSSPMHVFICGRQGVEYETNEETEELKAVGLKMKAEGETAYEPHILIRMDRVRSQKTAEIDNVVAYAEKDRTGVLAGRTIINPSFETICKPLLGLLGHTQAAMMNTDEAAAIDAEELSRQEENRQIESSEILRHMSAEMDLAEDSKAIIAIGKKITTAVKAKMTTADIAALREKFLSRKDALGIREPGMEG